MEHRHPCKEVARLSLGMNHSTLLYSSGSIFVFKHFQINLIQVTFLIPPQLSGECPDTPSSSALLNGAGPRAKRKAPAPPPGVKLALGAANNFHDYCSIEEFTRPFSMPGATSGKFSQGTLVARVLEATVCFQSGEWGC